MSLWNKFKDALKGGSGFGSGGGSSRTSTTKGKDYYTQPGYKSTHTTQAEARNKAELEKLARGSVTSSPSFTGGYSGGLGYVSGPSASSIGSGLTKVKAPDRVTYDNLGKDLQALYDEFGYYTPDWDKLDKSQEDIMGIFGQQRDNISAEHDLAKEDIKRAFDRSMTTHEKGQDYRRKDFADARRQLTEDSYMQGRDVEAGAASRGLGDSGVKEMAQIQGRMAMGEGMSNFADQYYRMEEEATEAINYAREDYETTTVKLQQTLQSALTDIAGAEVMSTQQYTDKIEQMKRQLSADKTAVSQAKQNFLETEMNSRLALAGFQQAQYDTELQAEFSRADLAQRQADSQQSYNLAQQQMSQQAAQHAESMQAQTDAMKDAGNLNSQQRADGQRLLQGLADRSISRADAERFANTSEPAVRDFIMANIDAYAPKADTGTSNKKNNKKPLFSLSNFPTIN